MSQTSERPKKVGDLVADKFSTNKKVADLVSDKIDQNGDSQNGDKPKRRQIVWSKR